jgi:hypothetical protein
LISSSLNLYFGRCCLSQSPTQVHYHLSSTAHSSLLCYIERLYFRFHPQPTRRSLAPRSPSAPPALPVVEIGCGWHLGRLASPASSLALAWSTSLQSRRHLQHETHPFIIHRWPFTARPACTQPRHAPTPSHCASITSSPAPHTASADRPTLDWRKLSGTICALFSRSPVYCQHAYPVGQLQWYVISRVLSSSLPRRHCPAIAFSVSAPAPAHADAGSSKIIVARQKPPVRPFTLGTLDWMSPNT